ncbi:MAG: hypothetical protein HY055_02265 [Magnetospirillum sp.]|nr:hypothetical protein [Magnetospirillum sp.]
MADDSGLQAVRREVARMRQDYETRIQELESRLAQAETRSNTATTTADEAKKVAQQAAASKDGAPKDTAGAFNPSVAVVLNGTATAMKRDPGIYRVPGFALGDAAKPVDRGFALGESEVTFAANVDHTLYGALTLSLSRENTASVEEAFIQSSSLPWGFTVKGGRFKSGIGYLNEHHAHTWDFADAPLPYLLMLNGQYGDDGLQVRWLAPTAMFVELGMEGFRGASFPADGTAAKGMGAASAFLHLGDDIGQGGEGGSWRAGISHLLTRAERRKSNSDADTFKGRDGLTIVDALYKWAPDGNFTERYVTLQGEYFHRAETGTFNDLRDESTQQGYYAQAVWQFMPRWRIGARHDRAWNSDVNAELVGTTLDSQGRTASRQSLMLDYSTSEFGRFRLQGNLDHSADKPDQQVILQYTVSLGAHGAHAY